MLIVLFRNSFHSGNLCQIDPKPLLERHLLFYLGFPPLAGVPPSLSLRIDSLLPLFVCCGSPGSQQWSCQCYS